MLLKILETLRKNEGFLGAYNEGMSRLWSCGIFDFLKENARPRKTTGDVLTSEALECARSKGYFECIEDILWFREKYFDAAKPKENIPMDFGATDMALEKGDLLKEEADAIRSGQPVNYEAIISSSNDSISGSSGQSDSGGSAKEYEPKR